MNGSANLATSVRARLLNRARERGEDFNYLLTRYGNERLLYRLARSPHRDRFVLKGATLFDVWGDWSHRTSRDVDLLGIEEDSDEQMRMVFRELAALEVAPDGLAFDAGSVSVEPIRGHHAYGGYRVRLRARLGTARLSLQVDVGFGDAVTPEIVEAEYPTLLAFPAPRLQMYPRETVVAEKFEAIVRLGTANTRLKDFLDLWEMAQRFDFDGEVLASALEATFKRRRTLLPTGMPIGLSPEFAADDQRGRQWSALLARSGRSPEREFESVVESLQRFLLPPATAAESGSRFERTWEAGGGWRDRAPRSGA